MYVCRKNMHPEPNAFNKYSIYFRYEKKTPQKEEDK